MSNVNQEPARMPPAGGSPGGGDGCPAARGEDGGDQRDLPLLGLLDRYAESKLGFTARSKGEYASTLSALRRHLGRAPTVADLNDATITAFISARYEKRSAPTAKKDLRQILTLWRWAWRKNLTQLQPRDVPEVPCPHREPVAHMPDEFAAILAACDGVPEFRGWTGRHWRALLLTAYDTAERIGALLACPLSAFDPAARVLQVPGWCRKRGHDHVSTLHPETVAAIEALGDRSRTRLFAWPGCLLSAERHLKKIIRRAGLPVRKGVLFHSVRKLSFSLVYDRLGADAARRHCGHQYDLSRNYLDRRLLTANRGADVLPRPTTSTG
jgi:site-specific recombinase XerD